MACNQMPSKGLGTFDGERLVAWSATIGWVSKPNTNHCRMPNGMPSSLFGKPIVGDGLGFHHRLWLAKPNASIKQSSNDCWMLAIFWDWLPNGIHHLRWHETKWHAIFWETKWHQTKWQTQLPSIDDAITSTSFGCPLSGNQQMVVDKMQTPLKCPTSTFGLMLDDNQIVVAQKATTNHPSMVKDWLGYGWP